MRGGGGGRRLPLPPPHLPLPPPCLPLPFLEQRPLRVCKLFLFPLCSPLSPVPPPTPPLLHLPPPYLPLPLTLSAPQLCTAHCDVRLFSLDATIRLGGGGGWQILLGQNRDYLFSAKTQLESLYFQAYQVQNVYFHLQQNFEKAPPPRKKKTPRKGGTTDICICEWRDCIVMPTHIPLEGHTPQSAISPPPPAGPPNKFFHPHDPQIAN